MMTVSTDYTDDERRLVLQDQLDGKSPDQIAQHLAHERALATVQSILRRDQSRIATEQYRAANRFHIFGVLAAKIFGGSPAYNQYRVHETNRAAFAKWCGVKEADLLKVSSGEKERVGKLRQGLAHGNLDTPRPKAKATSRDLPIWDLSGMNEKHLPGPAVAMHSYQGHENAEPAPNTTYFYPVQTWTPPDVPIS